MGRRRRKEREYGGKRELTELGWHQDGLYSGGRKRLVDRHGQGAWVGGQVRVAHQPVLQVQWSL